LHAKVGIFLLSAKQKQENISRQPIFTGEIKQPVKPENVCPRLTFCLAARLNSIEPAKKETLYIMELMDRLRKTWGIHYPMDDIS